jgi:predicted RNA-binding Zn ribbon-like protein
MQIQAHQFRPRDLVGGDVVLDLVNTVTARNALPVDWLDGYPRLLEWARLSGSFDVATLDELARVGALDPSGSEMALDRLRQLREALLEVFAAAIERRDPPPDRLRQLERAWQDAAQHAHLGSIQGHVHPELSIERSGLDYLRDNLALRAMDLLDSMPMDRTRVCPGSACGWLFVDTSRGGKRRWCDMATCGNASKGRRHYHRQRTGGNAQPIEAQDR